MKYIWTMWLIISATLIAILSWVGMIQDSVHFPLVLVLIAELLLCIGIYLMWKQESKRQSQTEVGN